ncbi:MAG: T9SS type A sorting domain-containing protein, partial [Candidatus Delongbacteria bacterium]|nr:T9SS type A sorting domain-containing protein [Candidatus Delongbacteria bacterium]
DLDNIRNYLESSFIQTADIDLGVAPWNVGEGWEPIGDYDWTDPTKSFRGNYDGDGYEIANMYINRPSESSTGVFGSSDGVFFQKMNVLNFDITSGSLIGGVVGISYNDSISNCIATGIIDGTSVLGLLAGFFEGYDIKDCHVGGEIISQSGYVGGGVGRCNADTLMNCSATVNITSEGIIVGGLFGDLVDTNYIERCYAVSDINSTSSFVGGLIGGITICDTLYINKCFSKGSIITESDKIGGLISGASFRLDLNQFFNLNNCFSNCDVKGNDIVGGLIGKLTEATTITNCYSNGVVEGITNIGGLIGVIDSLNSVNITNSYWDTETSSLLTTAGNLGEGRTTVEMTDPHAGNTYIGWDFTGIWVEDDEFHNDGYPYLSWHDTGIIEVEELIMENYELFQNYPNPFNNQTKIEYALQDMNKVDISIYNSNGQFVKSLVNKKMNKGKHSVLFDADNLNSGIYYYQLKIDGVMKETKKMLYLR